MARKLGVYVCSGCAIGEAVDTDRLLRSARSDFKIAASLVHPFLCGSEAGQAICKDIAEGAVDAAVIGACSPRVKTDIFSFDAVAVERVNLREHVAWSHVPRQDQTQSLAEDYLKMGLARAQRIEPLDACSEPASTTVLVVGGGMTGLTAALEAADVGHDVVLIEKQAALGGFMASVDRRFPVSPPYHELAINRTSELVATVSYHPRIRTLTSATILQTSGQPGSFDVTVQTEAGVSILRVGAIVLATGWKPYDAKTLVHLGHGLSPNVVTNVEFERMAARGPIARPSDGRALESVLFVQCAGSRDAAHLSYCSSVCCMATLKHAVYVHDHNPDARVYVVYRDMRTPGPYERFYRAAQQHPLNFFTKGTVTQVTPGDDGNLVVSVESSLVGPRVTIEVDLVVLAVGLVPNAADGEALRALADATMRARAEGTDAQRAEASKRVEALRQHEGTEILHLTYRQGPDLPVLKHGFPDSNFVCFPYETRRTGIYAAGAMRAPMDAARSEDDARGAALKAIQSLRLAATGAAAHPRAGDLSVPLFALQRCTRCKRCTEECPFGALDEDEKGTPKPNPHRCRRCGVCMGACPERIVGFRNYSIDMISSMIKAIDVPEDEDVLRALVLMCENDAYPALDIAGLNRLACDPSVRVIPVRCLGSVNIVWIADALARGIDGVLLVGCRHGDDYQCHFARGSELARRRLENVKETLQRLQLESARIELAELAIDEYGRLPALIGGFVDRLRAVGPNPYKGL